MHLKQVIPGAANVHPNNVCRGTCYGSTFLVYSSSKKVVILHSNLIVKQVLLHTVDVSSLACCYGLYPIKQDKYQDEEDDKQDNKKPHLEGMIAAAVGDSVVVYAPFTIAVEKKIASKNRLEQFEWKKVLTLKHDFYVSALSWRLSDGAFSLLVAGSSMALWKIEQKTEPQRNAKKKFYQNDELDGDKLQHSLVWKWADGPASPTTNEQPQSPTYLIRFCTVSPDGKYFATAGEYDRLVKVWYKYTSAANTIDRIKNNSTESEAGEHFRFIYLGHPRSVSNIIWRQKGTESDQNCRFQPNVLLTVCRTTNVIRLWLETPQTERFQMSVCQVIEPGPTSVIDWLDPVPGLFELRRESMGERFKDNQALLPPHAGEPRTQRHAIVPSDQTPSVDWIVSIQKNGTGIIWKVRGLSDVPKRAPSSAIWAKFNLLPVQPSTSLSVIAMVTNFRSEMSPAKFNLFVLSSQGSITRWECEEPGDYTPRVQAVLSSTSFGHKASICNIVVHPTLSLLASTDTSQRTLLWRCDEPRLVDPPFVLRSLSTLFDTVTAFAWTPSNQFVMTSSLLGVLVHGVELIPADANVDSGVQLAGILVESHQYTNLKCLEVFSLKPNYWTVVGLTSDTQMSPRQSLPQQQQFLVWQIQIPQPSLSRGETNWDAKKAQKLGNLCQNVFIENNAKIACISRVNSSVFVVEENQGNAPHAYLMSGSINGSVSIWKITCDNMSKIATFNLYASLETVQSIKCSSFGYFATSSSRRSNQIHVWHVSYNEIHEKNFRVVLEKELKVDMKTQDSGDVHFDWLDLHDGGHVLAVAHGHQVALVEQRYDENINSFDLVWQQTPIKTLDFPVESIAWTQDGSLVCAASNELHVFAKWTTSSTDDLLHLLHEPTLLHRNSFLYGPLPFYHPKLLVQYFMGGQSEKVGAILKHLSQFLENSLDSTANKQDIHWVSPLSLEFLVNGAQQPKKAEKKEDTYSLLDSSSDNINVSGEKETNQQLFSSEDAKKLEERLATVVLPHVSPTEQMHLLAVIDTFRQIQETHGAIDPCGQRFLLSSKIFSFVSRSLPQHLKPTALTSASFAWALHSEAEDQLLNACLPADAVWQTVRTLGIGLWVRNPTTLRNLAEKMAKAQFMLNKDPNECALLYLALDKKPALVALFKAVRNTTVYDFLKNDFTTEKWKTAALKNAYVLLGKQRFELAAAFFLLGGQLKDAVNILLKKLEDYQLALVVARLVEGEGGQVFQYVLREHVIPKAKETGDNYLESSARWLLKEYSESVNALLRNASHTESADSILDRVTNYNKSDPSILHFFNFLRGHTMLRNSPLKFDEIHFDLVKQSASAYSDAGYSLLAIEQLIPLVEKAREQKAKKATEEAPAPKFFSLGGALGRFGRQAAPLRSPFDDDEEPASSNNTLKNSSDLQIEKDLDRTFIFKLAQQLLTQEIVEDQLDILIKAGPQAKDNVSMNQESKLLHNFEFLCSKLDVPKGPLTSELLKYCSQREYLRPQYRLLGDSLEQSVLLRDASWKICKHLVEPHTPNQSPAQALQMALLSREIYECVKSSTWVKDSDKSSLLYGVYVGFFIYSWNQYNYALLHRLFTQDISLVVDAFSSSLDRKPKPAPDIPTAFEPKREILTGLQEENYDIPDENVKVYLNQLIDLTILRKFTIQVTTFGMHKDTAVERWLLDLAVRMDKLPRHVHKALKASIHNGTFDTYMKFFGNFMLRMHPNDESFIQLWNYLSQDAGVLKFINDLQFAKAKDLATMLVKGGDLEGTHTRVKFQQEPEVIYKHKDILQSFCVNARDPSQIALATVSGIREIIVTREPRRLSVIENTHDGHDQPDTDRHNKLGDLLRQDSTMNLSPFRRLKKGTANQGPAISKQVDHNIVVQWLEPHPVRPCYLSGGVNGSISLWQFNAPRDQALMSTYRLTPHPRINRIHFNDRGTKFGACDMDGSLALWGFEPNEGSMHPFWQMQTNTKRTLDFCFMNCGSLLASAGISDTKRNIIMWDILLAPQKSIVYAFTGHEGGASSIVYSARHQLLISGGKKGEIVLFDVRQRKIMETVNAHDMNVKTLGLSPREDFLVSGSSDGNVKVWDLLSSGNLNCFQKWDSIHEKRTFVRKPGVFSALSTYGVMQAVLTDHCLYTCGSDGRMLATAYEHAKQS